MTEKENKKPPRSKLDFSTKLIEDPKRISKDKTSKSYTYVTVNDESNPEGFKYGRRTVRVLVKYFEGDKQSEPYIFWPSHRIVLIENSVAHGKLKTLLKGTSYNKDNFKDSEEFVSELENNVYDWSRLIRMKNDIKVNKATVENLLNLQPSLVKDKPKKNPKEKEGKKNPGRKPKKQTLPKSPTDTVSERN